MRNVRLQYLRAVAAIAVLLYHATFYLGSLRGSDSFASIFNGYWGTYGVAVFFALSGFLMAELLRRDDPGFFLVSRLARIYPPLLLTTGLFVLVFFITGYRRGIDAVGLTLVPVGPRDYFLGVEWTLLYEMTYYTALASIAFLGLRRFAALFAVLWLVAVLGAWLASPGRPDILTPMLSEVPLQPVNLAFLFGYLVSPAARRGWLPPGLAAAAACVALAGPFVTQNAIRIVAAIAAVLLVAAAVRAPKAEPEGVAGRIGMRLGDASYMLYLCHVPVILLTSSLLPKAVPDSLVWMGWVVGAIAVALVLARADLGMHRWCKLQIKRAPAERLRIISLGFIAVFFGLAAYAEYDIRIKRGQEARAEAILASTVPAAQASVRGEIDSAAKLSDGTHVVRGYGIDLDKPRLVSHVAILQGGKVLAVDRMRRMRVATARELARPDLAAIRFGFAVILPASLDCGAGPLEARFVLDDGRVVPIAPGSMAGLCP